MTATAAPLSRKRDDRVIAGVCAGLAEHLGVPVRWARVAMVAFALLGGAGALFYAWLWVLVPAQGDTAPVAPMRSVLTKPAAGAPGGSFAGSDGGADRAAGEQTDAQGPTPLVDRAMRWPVAELLLGACLLAVGIGLVLAQQGVEIRLDVLLPAMAVFAGVGLTWWQIADRERPERHVLPRVLGALLLVAVGVLMFFVTSSRPSALTVIGAAIAVLAGVALALAPWALRINRELIAERSARAREAERAEIAAHLHDSVLQTLAAIQQRSDPGSEIARLARGQERDLREWLFRSADGEVRVDREAAEATLREYAATLEAEHPVRFEVVAVGARDVMPEPVVAAAREAMLNAARHAGGDVTVYLESGADRVSIDVTDRGPGLDLERLPAGRMGVAESILGRMQRAGGEARIVPGPGGAGTAVRLSMPLAEQSADTAQGNGPQAGASEADSRTAERAGQPSSNMRQGEYDADR